MEELEEEEQELEQVEMLLETYFMQLDQLHERLLDMKENIEAAAVRQIPVPSMACGMFARCDVPQIFGSRQRCRFRGFDVSFLPN